MNAAFIDTVSDEEIHMKSESETRVGLDKIDVDHCDRFDRSNSNRCRRAFKGVAAVDEPAIKNDSLPLDTTIDHWPA